jgi:hypothetical protein
MFVTAQFWNTISTPDDLDGCKTSSLTLRKGYTYITGYENEEKYLKLKCISGKFRTYGPINNNEKLRVLYKSSGVIAVMKSRKLHWAGHVVKNRR